MSNWFEELLFQHRRRAQRHPEPRLVAYYWDGGTPTPHNLQDVSSTGFYLLTDQRWYPGTVITMTLQRTEKSEDGSRGSVAVLAKVIRSGEDGVALRFVFPRAEDARKVSHIVAEGVKLADEKTLALFLRPLWVNGPTGAGGGAW